MDQRERIKDSIESLKSILEGYAIELWTSLPGILQDLDPTDGTCSIQPAIKGIVRDSKGNMSEVSLPQLIKVPLVMLHSSEFLISLPIKKGDECLVIFSSRCIDEWWRQGGEQSQTSLRLHDMQDGFAIVGPFSKPTVFANINTDNLQIRNKNGNSYIEMTPDGAINIKAPGGLNISGTLTSDSDGNFNGHTVGQHTHSNPEGGVVGPPQG